MGAGGIGFDVGEYLSHQGPSITENKEAWFKEWGVDIENKTSGGLQPMEIEASPRKLYLFPSQIVFVATQNHVFGPRPQQDVGLGTQGRT